MRMKYRKSVSYIIILLSGIAIGVAISLLPKLIKHDTLDNSNAHILQLKSHISNNYMRFGGPDDHVLRKELKEAGNALQSSYIYNNRFQQGYYPPDLRWMIFISNDNTEFLGIFLGKNYRVISKLNKKSGKWIVTELKAIETPKDQ